MKALADLTNRAMNVTAVLASLGALVMMVHICAEVVSRNLFGTPIPATVEIVSQYYMVLLAFLPIAWLERRGGMVSVEAIDFLLSPAARRWSDVSVSLVSAAVYAGLAYTTWLVALKNYATGTFVTALEVALPTWPTYFLPPLGFALAVLVTLFRAVALATGVDDARMQETVRT
ncbi:TRAP-type C4-dicarboxylate transport system permease small subunit [Amorphus suaedae]